MVMTAHHDYTFVLNGNRWLDALDKNTTKNVTLRYDMIAMIENEYTNDDGSIEVQFENCSFIQNGNEIGVIGNVFVDDPFGIATVTWMNNEFILNEAKVGSTLVHLSGYRLADESAIDLSANHEDMVVNCTFINNTASDTGNIIIHNADLTFTASICDSNTVGLDGSCIVTYSSTLDVRDAVIVNSVMQVSGAIYTDLSILRIQDANFTNNVAKYGDGSCIFAQRMIPLILGDCPPSTFQPRYDEFSNNDTAHQHYLLSVFQCLFDSNKAYNGSGGAIYIGTDYDTRLLNATCINSTQSIYEDDTERTTRRRLLQFNDSNTTAAAIDTISPTQFPTAVPTTTADCIDIRIVPDIHVTDISWQLRGLYPNGTFTSLKLNGTGAASPYCADNVFNDSCVQFTITDSFADGLLYGEGTWSVAWRNEEWTSPSGGNYYAEEALAFCLSSVYEEEAPASIDIVVSIIDDTNSLDFIIAFLDDIVPKFEYRIESNLVFSSIGNREIESYLFDNSAEMCLNNADGIPVYCSDYGNEAIIDALAVLCIWQRPSNHTWFDDFQDYWGDRNSSYFAGNDSASFEFLTQDCDLVDIREMDGTYQLLNGMQLLNKSFQLFHDQFEANDDEIVEMTVPQIGGRVLTSSDPWTTVWADANTQTICEYYNANPTVIELICDNIALDIAIQPLICQYDSCRSQGCSAEDVIIVYNSESQRLFEEDAYSFAYDTGADVYEIIDLEYVMIGEFGLDAECYGNYPINETQVADKGVLVFTNSTCDHHSFVLRLQNAGARAVIIGEDVAIPVTPAPTLSPTMAPTTTAVDRLWIFLNATLHGVNITHFEQKLDAFMVALNESLSVPTAIPHYTSGASMNEIKMVLFLDATHSFELWSSLNGDGSEIYTQLLKWSIQFGVEDTIDSDATFAFDADAIKLSRIEPTPRPTPEPTPLPTVAPTVLSIYIPVRILDHATGRQFAETAYFMSVLNYTNPNPYVNSNNDSDSNAAIVAGVNDLKVSFVCNITLPTPAPTAEPTEAIQSLNESETYLSDEISIYGFNSDVSDSAVHAHPQWIVLLSEYVLNATCNFVDRKNDALDVNDTSKCKPRLDHLYDKCLMEVAVNEDGSSVEKRTAQIDTIVFPADTLCIYMNIGENPGFLVPYSMTDDDNTMDLVEDQESDALPLIFEQSATANHSRPCQSKYKEGGNGLINVNNLRKGTYCFFIDSDEDNSYQLVIKPVYRWMKPFIQIYQSIFIENMARKNGGAVAISADDGSIGDYSSIIIKDCAFYENNASRGLGGAVYKLSAVDDRIENVMAILIVDNITENAMNEAGFHGGSVAITAPEFSNLWRSAVLMNNVKFERNFAIWYGGAIYSEWSNLYILDCIFDHNMVLKSGGAIYLVHSGFAVLNSDFLFNEAINVSSDWDKTRDKNVRFEYDNDGGAVFSSFYNEKSSNPPCVGFYNIFLQNNTAGNVGGALWLGLYGNEAQRGLSCIKLSNIKFGNATYQSGTANKAYDGGRAIFLNVSSGIHPILFGETSVTQLCFSESNICKQFESTVYHMCVQPYAVAAGVCNVNVSSEIERRRIDWVDTIHSLSLASGDSDNRNI